MLRYQENEALLISYMYEINLFKHKLTQAYWPNDRPSISLYPPHCHARERGCDSDCILSDDQRLPSAGNEEEWVEEEGREGIVGREIGGVGKGSDREIKVRK